jgi:NAD-dependent SIR2 family protein deacetylase
MSAELPQPENLGALVELFSKGPVLVLTGAGVSTESGIPDYRDEQGEWKRATRPVQYRDFVGSEATRRRYWARSLVGWQHMGAARPNRAHRALAELEQHGCLALLVTQNVDGLHQAAGSVGVVDLHGRLDRVVCLGCQRLSSRESLQARLAELNPEWVARIATHAPDGDADLVDADTSSFRVVDCAACHGILKPDVVFFGENVPARRVEVAMAALERANSLVIVGSSLMVFSGFRFARAALKRDIPIAIINQGRTRADEHAAVKLDGNAGAILSELVASLR